MTTLLELMTGLLEYLDFIERIADPAGSWQHDTWLQLKYQVLCIYS